MRPARTTALALGLALFGSLPALSGCKATPEKSEKRTALIYAANDKLREFKTYPVMQQFFNDAYAYVVFPAIGKGGFIVGGSYGRGVVYGPADQPLGFADVSSGTIGALAGGQGFSEIIFFENQDVFDEFREGKFALSAQAAAVVLDAGGTAQAAYDEGVAVFVKGESGLMLDVSVGGQGFDYEPM